MCKNGCAANTGINKALVLPVDDPNNPGRALEYLFTAKRPLVVTSRQIGNQMHVHFEIKEYVAQKAALTAAPATFEVGQTVTGTYTALITPGSDAIVSRAVTPEDYILNGEMDNDFSFTKAGITAVKPGLVGVHTLHATDESGKQVSSVAALKAQDRVFVVYSTKRVLEAADLQAIIDADSGTVVDNIRAGYGGLRNYVIPPLAGGLKHYIHWLYTSEDAGIGQPVDDYNTPVPVEVAPSLLSVTNKHGLALNYYDAHTMNSYGGTTFKISI